MTKVKNGRQTTVALFFQIDTGKVETLQSINRWIDKLNVGYLAVRKEWVRSICIDMGEGGDMWKTVEETSKLQNDLYIMTLFTKEEGTSGNSVCFV